MVLIADDGKRQCHIESLKRLLSHNNNNNRASYSNTNNGGEEFDPANIVIAWHITSLAISSALQQRLCRRKMMAQKLKTCISVLTQMFNSAKKAAREHINTFLDACILFPFLVCSMDIPM